MPIAKPIIPTEMPETIISLFISELATRGKKDGEQINAIEVIIVVSASIFNSLESIIIYQTERGKTKLDVRFQDETVWLTQAQLCELFDKSKASISEHIKHIFEEVECYNRTEVINL